MTFALFNWPSTSFYGFCLDPDSTHHLLPCCSGCERVLDVAGFSLGLGRGRVQLSVHGDDFVAQVR